MADSNSTSKFPAPYVDSVSESSPVVIRVNQDFGEIGSRPSQAPKDVMAVGMGIVHVGNSTDGSRGGSDGRK